MIHDERNVIQHKFSNPDSDTAKFHIENALQFFERFLFQEFDIRIIEIIPQELLSNKKLGFTPEESKIDKLLKSAEENIIRDRSASVLSSFNALELLIRDKLEDKGIPVSDKSIMEVFGVAALNVLIDKDDFNKIKVLVDIRSQVAHSDLVPPAEEWKESLGFIKILIQKIKNK